MLGTMQDVPLSIGQLLRYGSSVHGTSTVATWTGSESRVATYAQIGRRAAQLAHALRQLGVDGDQRVGTFMWNNNEHLEAYLAVPSMGAVLHTLNIRLFPEQLIYVVNHAEDYVIIVDGTLVPLLNKQLSQFTTVRHVVVANGDPATVEAPEGVEVHGYEDLLSAQPEEFDWPTFDENTAAAMCYTSGTTGDPKGVVYSHRSIWLHSLQVCAADGLALSQADKTLAIVPQFHAMSWGLPYAAFMSGSSLVMPDRFLQPEPIAKILAAEKPTHAAAVPTVWQGLLQYLDQNPQDISHLREVVVGGSAVPPSLMHAFMEKHNVPVLHAWGMTETAPLGSVARPPAEAPGAPAGAAPRAGAAGLGQDRRGAAGQRGSPARGAHRRAGVRLPVHRGPLPRQRAGATGRRPGQRAAVGRQECRPARGGGPVDRGRLLPRPRPGEVPRRLAAHRRRRAHHPGRIPDVDRPGQGRHQVRR